MNEGTRDFPGFEQHPLGQRRAVIGPNAFSAKQQDRTRRAFRPQRLGRSRAREAAADQNEIGMSQLRTCQATTMTS
jgi:hypothetical protein